MSEPERDQRPDGGDRYPGDRIFLRGLRAQCIIGFIDWERRTPQTLLVDLEIPCDCTRAARHDKVEDTIDYKRVAKRVLAWLPFEHIAYTPLQIYLGKLDREQAVRALATEWFWVFALLVLAHLWWNRSLRNITIHGG